MTGALEEFLRRQEKVPELWELLTGHPTSDQIRRYNEDFDRKHPGVSEMITKHFGSPMRGFRHEKTR